MSRLRLLPLALLVAPALGGTAHAAALPADSTAILSGAPSLAAALPAPVADAYAYRDGVSQDGRYVAFVSNSDGLSPDDDDRLEISHVYVKDMATGAVTIASRRTGVAGALADRGSDEPAISDGGRRVAFVTSAALDPADVNGQRDVYVRDLVSGTTTLVSRATGNDGAIGDRDSWGPALSETGSVVAFVSRATNLGGATGGVDQVYVRKLEGPGSITPSSTTLVSRADGADGAPPAGSSGNPSISDDGDRVAFDSRAGNLVAGDAADSRDVFVRMVQAGRTVLASRADGFAGALANGASEQPAISGDGGHVAFVSAATNLDPLDTTTDSDVYLRSLASGSTNLVDQAGGVKALGGAFDPAIDDSGDAIAFSSYATNLDPADRDPGGDVYVSRGLATVTLASRHAASGAAGNRNGSGPGISGDGGQVLLTSDGSLTGEAMPGLVGVALRDLAAATTRSVSRPAGTAPFGNAGGWVGGASASADGRFVAFASSAPGLGAPPDGATAIVVRDTVTGATALASREDGPAGAPMRRWVGEPSISADGRWVAFTAPGAPGEPVRVWARDLVAGTTVLVSRANGAAGAAANGPSHAPTISDDGSRVAFVTRATNLGDGDGDSAEDVHVRDLTTGSTLLASRADGAAGAKANQAVYEAVLSGDGRHVAFTTPATNLGDGDTDPRFDVHVRDLASGRTRLASRAPGSAGAKGDDNSFAPSISADGSRVAFASYAANLGLATTSSRTHVWVRDLGAATTTLASRADGAVGAPVAEGASAPVISADGRVVAFDSGSPDIAPGLPAGGGRAFVRDLSAQTTTLVSRAPGPAGAPTAREGGVGDVTADGACVVFRGDGELLGPPGTPDFAQLYLRVRVADCGRPDGGGGGGGGGGGDDGGGGRQPDDRGRPESPSPPRDTTAPRLRGVSLTRTRFRVARTPTARAAARSRRPRAVARGTELRFTTSEAGRLTLRIERSRPGRLSGRGRGRVCRAVRRQPRRGRCTVWSATATLTRKAGAGNGRVALSGRIGRARMAAGRYRLTITVTDVAGNRSAPVRRAFAILPG